MSLTKQCTTSTSVYNLQLIARRQSITGDYVSQNNLRSNLRTSAEARKRRMSRRDLVRLSAVQTILSLTYKPTPTCGRRLRELDQPRAS